VLEFRLLGPLEVASDAGPIEISGQRQRALLALLVLRASQVVPSETLVELLWGEEPPRTAPTSLQNAVSQLRKLLGPSILLTKPPGYVLDIDREQVDLGRFQRLVGRARTAEPAERLLLLRDALALWRGAPLADFAFEPWAQAEVHGLEELRLSALEDLLDAELELGQHVEVVAEAERLVRDHPLRERPIGQLMLALYRSGRQADALRVFHGARTTLVDELGIDPSPELQALYTSILRQERTLTPAAPTAPSDHYAEVLRALATGRVVPVLGTGIGAGLGPDDLAKLLGERFDCAGEHVRGLPYISQYVAARNGVGPLWDELHQALDRDFEPGAVHTWLASLPSLLRERGLPYQLIVTAGFDSAVERAFADAGEELDVVSYLAGGRDRGRFLHVRPDGTAAVVQEPNTYVGLSLERRTVLLRIHGQVDRTPERERESFAVSEDDHIDYLTGVESTGTVPVTLAARLRRNHLLFLGYAVHDWSLRVFLRRVWGHDRLAYRSWAVQAAAEPVARDLWRERGVEVYELELDAYASELARLSSELAPLEATA
jgi:DNA-binding SARP family transcriptional activator